MPYVSVYDLYKFLSPEGQRSSLKKGVKSEDALRSALKKYFLDANGTMYPTVSNTENDDSISKIEDTFTGLTEEETNKEYSRLYHVISNTTAFNKGVDGKLNLSDSDYWGKSVSTLGDIIPRLKEDPKFKCTAFITRDPSVSPATRGTPTVDFFLNYTPSIVAAQMVPYLDVEFEIRNPILESQGKGLYTPSPLRFLLGSRPVDSNTMSPIDLVMAEEAQNRSSNEFNNNSSTSQQADTSIVGMENFLMPQSLTNMDNLNDLGVRLVRPKPFIPFASIEGLDIQIMNAGFKDLPHKQGTLKMKFHDKSRISEMSQFFRGPMGFEQVIVWTTMGWLAPQGRPDDEYAKFINESMLTRDCWRIQNAQFAFDTAGQADVTLQLFGHAVPVMREIRTGSTKSDIPIILSNFHKTLEAVNEIQKGLKENKQFALSMRRSQLLESAATTGIFKDFNKKEIKEAIDGIRKDLSDKNKFDQNVVEDLIKNLNLLNEDGPYNYKKVENDVATKIKEEIDRISNTPDPFLPNSNRILDPNSNSGYFRKSLVDKVEDFTKESNRRNLEIDNKKKADSKKSPTETPGAAASPPVAANKPDEKNKAKRKVRKNLKKQTPVVSFGKLFLHLVAPAVACSPDKICDELQVCFYSLNNQCGPASGISIAEFPIDLRAFEYAYAKACKEAHTDQLTITALFNVFVSSQFGDIRAIGYGKNQFYEPYFKSPDEEKKKAASGKNKKGGSDDPEVEWTRTYGTLQLPALEMFVETGDASLSARRVVNNLTNGSSDTNSKSASGQPLITKIHIYDKTVTPHQFALDIINGYQVGDRTKVQGALTGALEKLNAEQRQLLIEALEDDKNKNKTLDEIANSPYDSKQHGEAFKELVSVLHIGQEDLSVGKWERDKVKSLLLSQTPSIQLGANGSLVTAVNLASKTDGLQGSMNLASSIRNTAAGKASLGQNALEEKNGLPLYTVPAQLTMTTFGVPNAQLYQEYYVDFDTGTQIDTLYKCNQLTHSISRGKFSTQWTFIYADGYGKYKNPPGFVELASTQNDSNSVLLKWLKANPK